MQHPKTLPTYILLPHQPPSWHYPRPSPVCPWFSCHFYFIIIFTCWFCSWADCPLRPQSGVPNHLPGTRITGGKGICVKLYLRRGEMGLAIYRFFIRAWDREIPMFMRIKFSWKLLLISIERWISTLWKNCNSEIIKIIPNFVNMLIRLKPGLRKNHRRR